MKTASKHERFIEDLGDDIRVTPGFGFYLRPSYSFLGHMQFFRGFYGAKAVGASASHDISHMRRRYSALSALPVSALGSPLSNARARAAKTNFSQLSRAKTNRNQGSASMLF